MEQTASYEQNIALCLTKQKTWSSGVTSWTKWRHKNNMSHKSKWVIRDMSNSFGFIKRSYYSPFLCHLWLRVVNVAISFQTHSIFHDKSFQVIYFQGKIWWCHRSSPVIRLKRLKITLKDNFTLKDIVLLKIKKKEFLFVPTRIPIPKRSSQRTYITYYSHF